MTWDDDLPPRDVLDGHRRAQRLAYDAAVEVAAGLAPGVTEREAAAALGRALAAHGVTRYFHAPFAWFGERTAFAGIDGSSLRARGFFATDAKIEAGMVGILDVAPIVGGFAADIGYTFCCGGEARPELARAMETLADIRDLIPRHVARGDTMRSIYVRIDRLLAERGLENRHRCYPFGVLGHRISEHHRLGHEPRLLGFGLSAATKLLGTELASRLPIPLRPSPLWTDGESSNRPLDPGLWAVEPHVGVRRSLSPHPDPLPGGATETCLGFGAKFEEILVVGRNRAFWLDDDLPHVINADRSRKESSPVSRARAADERT